MPELDQFSVSEKGSSDTKTFLHELRQIVREPVLLDALIDRWRGRPIRFALIGNRHKMIMTARHMLSQGMQRNQARDALMERFAISRRSAYRILEAAINQAFVKRH